MSIELRRQVLQNAIRSYLGSGYRVVSQTDTTAQLVQPKKFSFVLFVILCFACGVGLFYGAWYLSKKDQTVYIQVDEWGNVTRA